MPRRSLNRAIFFIAADVYPRIFIRGYQRPGRVFIRWLAVVFCIVSISGCKPAQPIVPDTLLPKPIETRGPLPTYGELIERYNQTTRPLTRVWAEARVDLVWRDDKGKRKSEHGDGRFMFVRPGKVVLEIEEFGRGFWAGGDAERYWLFDLQDQRIAYVGRYENLGKPGTQLFPLPVNPADLLYVLGLVPIDPTIIPQPPAVERVAGYYLIEPPGLGLRMLLDPKTARPIRVDLLDADGRSAVKCVLSKPTELKTEQKNGDGPRPVMPGVVEVYVLGQEARMTLKLKRPTTAGTRIKDAHFDFEILKRVKKPDEVVDLDTPDTPDAPPSPPEP